MQNKLTAKSEPPWKSLNFPGGALHRYSIVGMKLNNLCDLLLYLLINKFGNCLIYLLNIFNIVKWSLFLYPNNFSPLYTSINNELKLNCPFINDIICIMWSE